MNDLTEKENIEIQRYFQLLSDGSKESVNFDVPINVKPDWLDIDQFKKGQKFARDYLYCLNAAESLSLFMVFSLPHALDALIFTGKSHTPFKACKRYLSTFNRVKSWYDEDFFQDEKSLGKRNIAAVSAMHRNTQNMISSTTAEELQKRSTVGDVSRTCVWSTIRETALEDFKTSIPESIPDADYLAVSTKPGLPFNQKSMAVTQLAFVGFAVTFPKAFGMHFVSDGDLENFVHTWRVLGHYLGIEDQYNFCNEGLEGVRQRTLFFVTNVLKPSLRNVTSDWEHMSRCLVEGVSFYVPCFNFEAALIYICEVIGVDTPHLNSSMTYAQIYYYYFAKFNINVLCKLPGMVKILTKIMLAATDGATNAPPEKLQKWKVTEFPYMNQPGKVPIHIS